LISVKIRDTLYFNMAQHNMFTIIDKVQYLEINLSVDKGMERCVVVRLASRCLPRVRETRLHEERGSHVIRRPR